MDFDKAKVLKITMPAANDSVLSLAQSWHFLGSHATYCARDDSACGSWMATQRFGTNQTIDSRYCVGTAQCVAISVCEASRESVERCYAPVEMSSSNFNINIDLSLLWIVLCAILVPLAVVGLCCCWICIRRRRRDARADAAATEVNERLERPVQRRADVETVDASVPRAPLDLSGWRVQHAERIENEKLRLAGAGDVNVTMDLQQSVAEVEREREEEEEEDASTSYVRVEDRTNTTAPSA
ncbi:hypothetical protein P43SY_001603 [Pythium insidiosum]|uniref:Uncharacterized protein n=1 Tax=Pythium insidiosum TaxID=114742 RepID=A0AAD5QD82_PYTIN|nr:hypothetical protein P43SY_001603 [Pythium insidiosum]